MGKAKDLSGMRFEKLTVLERDVNKKGNMTYWICRCDCGNIVYVSGKELRRDDGKGTRSCGCIKSSIGEENIAKILIENNIEFEREYSFKELGALRYDFAIMENGKVVRLIEFDGEQHYNPNCKFYTEEGVKRDKLKNDFALKNNIPLIRITYDKRDIITLEDLL